MVVAAEKGDRLLWGYAQATPLLRKRQAAAGRRPAAVGPRPTQTGRRFAAKIPLPQRNRRLETPGQQRGEQAGDKPGEIGGGCKSWPAGGTGSSTGQRPARTLARLLPGPGAAGTDAGRDAEGAAKTARQRNRQRPPRPKQGKRDASSRTRNEAIDSRRLLATPEPGVRRDERLRLCCPFQATLPIIYGYLSVNMPTLYVLSLWLRSGDVKANSEHFGVCSPTTICGVRRPC